MFYLQVSKIVRTFAADKENNMFHPPVVPALKQITIMKKTYPELEKLLTVFRALGYESAYIEKDFECTDGIDGTSLEIPYYLGRISVWYVECEKSYFEVHITNDDDQDDYSEIFAYTREGVVLDILNEIF